MGRRRGSLQPRLHQRLEAKREGRDSLEVKDKEVDLGQNPGQMIRMTKRLVCPLIALSAPVRQISHHDALSYAEHVTYLYIEVHEVYVNQKILVRSASDWTIQLD